MKNFGNHKKSLNREMATKGKPSEDDLVLIRRLSKIQSGMKQEYKPGPYWKRIVKRSETTLRNQGLYNFRALGEQLGESFADVRMIDVRHNYGTGVRRILPHLTRIFPVSRIFDGQLHITRTIEMMLVKQKSLLISNSSRVKFLLEKYTVPKLNSEYGCYQVTVLNNTRVSNIYIESLDAIETASSKLSFNSIRSFMEIGAGFGANIDCLVTNFSNIRKYLIVDIFPTIFISYTYLKGKYPHQVRIIDSKFDSKQGIHFQENNDLELIFCLPQHLEEFEGAIDLVHNAHSMVEMSIDNLDSYSKQIERLQAKQLWMVQYDSSGLNGTRRVSEIIERFRLSTIVKKDCITDAGSEYHHLVKV